MNRQLIKRIEELQERVEQFEQRLNHFEHATLKMVDEKIAEATSGLVSLEEVGQYYELD